MAFKYLTKNEKIAIKEFKNKLLRELKGEILKLKLFGSKARGDARPWPDSDIDVLVILKRNSQKKEDFIMDLTGDLLHKHNALIEAKVFSKAEFKKYLDLQVPFYLEVQKEGVDI